jgi:YgiT-type zinc finger domain-containing protein
MRADTVKTAIWLKERLIVVEDIPAQVCDACMEQFYDDDTTDALRRLTEEGFASATPTRELVVPIFSLQGRITRRVISEEDLYADY